MLDTVEVEEGLAAPRLIRGTTTGERRPLRDQLPVSASTMIAGVFASAPLGREGCLGLGVVGDEGEEMIGEGVGAIMDISIAPGTLMVDEARQSTASLADCPFLGNESPAWRRKMIVKLTFCSLTTRAGRSEEEGYLSTVHGDA